MGVVVLEPYNSTLLQHNMSHIVVCILTKDNSDEVL